MTPARARARRRAKATGYARLAFAIALASSGASAATPSSAGRPGARPWIVERAELHGLSANALEEASSNVETIVSRDCFVVARDGVVVHESYYGGSDANTQTNADGVGTLALVAATGVAAQQGLLELDAPLSKYNVRSAEEAFEGRVDGVTVRQLLAQTHGGGSREPGSAFERDDLRTGPFLDIIGDIIETGSGMKLAEWARVNLAEKLGAPHMFESSSRADGADGASLWRDLRMTCRDAAKLGQLFINQGKWMSVDGSVRHMFDPSFAVEALSVSYPKLNQAHGFMTWLHVPVTPTGTQCCAPRTVKNSCGSSAEAISGPILGKNAPHAPVAVSMGDEGSMIFMLPETNTVVVTLGRTTPGSPACPAAPSDVVDTGGNGRRDDAYLLRTMWSAMGGALKPLELDAPSRKAVSQKEAALEHDWQRWKEKKSSKKSKGNEVAKTGSSQSASSSILDAVREAVAQVMGSAAAKDDGVVHDGHATYEVPDPDRLGEMSPTTFRAPVPKPFTPGEEAEEEYKRRQIEYARDMQEREYKKFESSVQADYREALTKTREKYQKDMRAAQKEKNAAVRAQKEDLAASVYLEAVNKIEHTGTQALQQLDLWRKATLPPLIDGEDATSSNITASRSHKVKGSDLGAVESRKIHDYNDIALAMDGVSAKLKRLAKGDSRSSRGSYAALGDAQDKPSKSIRGSCVCGCPNTKTSQATCFDIDASALGSEEAAANACASMHSRAGLGCPHTGIVQQCGEIIGKHGTSSDDLECRQVRRCPRTKEDASKTAFLAAVFDCRPTKFAHCAFVASPCAHSNIVIKPVASRALEADKEASTLAQPQYPRRAAHRFPEHEHTHLNSGNAMQRWFQNSSAEVSVGLVMAILSLALITIARNFPSAVTGGERFGAAPSKPRQRKVSAPERVPLLGTRQKCEPSKAVPAVGKHHRSTPSISSMSSDAPSPVMNVAEAADVVQRFPRPIKVFQPQGDELTRRDPRRTAAPKPAVRVPVVEHSEDDNDSTES